MHRVLVALGASTGMRRGELLALRYAGNEETTSWVKEASAIFVRKSIWGGKEQEPKSIAGVRQIDVSSSVNKMLTEYVEVEKKNPGDYLFCTRTGRPLTPSRVNELIMKPNNIPGAHSLRRYRSGYMDAQGCPRNFLSELMGHSLASNIDEIYIIRDDVEHRRKIVEKIGTGLDLAAATLPVSKSKAAKPRKTRKNVVRTDVPTNLEQMPKPVMPLVVSNLPEPVAPQPVVYTNVYTPEPEPQIDATLSEISRQPASVEQLDELLKMRAQLEALR